MLKFIRGKGQQPTAERQRLQKELFAYRKTAQHGFPHKPSAMAFDSKSKLMAIGTQNGAIKIFGQPGVEFYGQHTMQSNSAAELNVQLLEWVHGTGNILSLTAANQLILWEPVGSTLVAVKNLSFDGKLKKVSSLCCSYAKDIVWIGTEGGNIYQLDLRDFNVKEPAIYHDVVLEQVPPTYKLNPGAIESIKQMPSSWNQLLVAYNRGLCVLWDTETSTVVRSFIAPGHGQSVGLFVNSEGTQFTWYHADGSFASWDLSESGPPVDLNYVPYGPDPCKSINRLYKGNRGSDSIVVFSGGMPRSAYGDHNCVSIHVNNENKICLDFTSKVIDFFVTYQNDSDSVKVLIVLLEEELCAYDLADPKVPVIKAPYLHSIHASAVTCNQLISQVSNEVFEKIRRAGEEQDSECSKAKWPITGGVLPEKCDKDEEQNQQYDILLTGHEDGSVKFWNCTEVVMSPLYHLKTSILFGHENTEDIPPETSEPFDDSEPPFRKAGLFDPYSDDPRLAVKKLSFCSKSGRLIIGGTAGQIIIANFEGESSEKSPLKVTTMNLVSDRDGFVWKGHDQLNVRPYLLDCNAEPIGDPGVQITGILQVLPPASITCLALQTDWNLVSGGTAHGLVLFDFKNFLPVFHRCTLNPNDLTGAGEQLSRRKSFKKSLRESFRKLRKGRSTRNNPTQPATTLDARPVERQVEARSPDDGMGSMVRCLVFAKTYITNVHTTAATLWSATNASCVSVFLLHLPPPSTDNDGEQPPRRVSAQLAKEIQMKHRAPVVGIAVFDQSGIPLELSGPGTPPHRVLIASEEQFKVFSLPQLKPITKYKLTAHEGARVRRLAFALFVCKVPPEILQGSPTKSLRSESGVEQNPNVNAGESVQELRNYQEVGLLCLTNLGDILVLSIPELKRQLNAAAVRREDINGISSLCFTHFGEAFYMMSSSELQRISLGTAKVITPVGRIHVEHLERKEAEENSFNEQGTVEGDSTESINKPLNKNHISTESNGLTNGIEGSPNRGNETISSSMGDITVDSVRDHLNSTTTTLCSTTTEETVGRLSVLSTQTSQTVTSVNMKDITDFNITNLMDLAPLSRKGSGKLRSLHLPPPSTDNDGEQPPRRVSAQLAKEIQMKHRAPVVGIAVFDQSGIPLELSGPGTPPHRVLIASEEQFKVFSLPQLKPITKYKLTAHEGARVRRLAFALFVCKVPPEILQGSPTKSLRSESGVEQNPNVNAGESVQELRNYQEVGLLCLTNLGDILVLSIPELKRQLNAAAVRREDINGISSLCFTHFGEAFYMMSSSELQRISLGTAKVITPVGRIHVEHLERKEAEENSFNEQGTVEGDSTESINKPLNKNHISTESNGLTNGIEGSPNRGNETISSSMGDITVDSVRDHLNSTTTTLCSTTTEETVGRLSVLSTQTSQTVTSVNMKDITDFNITNLMDLAPLSNTTETSTSSVVIKSIITSISHEKTNGEPETITTKKTTTREESQL